MSTDLATFAESRQGSQFCFHHDDTSNKNIFARSAELLVHGDCVAVNRGADFVQRRGYVANTLTVEHT
jgi:hypothetical protein